MQIVGLGGKKKRKVLKNVGIVKVMKNFNRPVAGNLADSLLQVPYSNDAQEVLCNDDDDDDEARQSIFKVCGFELLAVVFCAQLQTGTGPRQES